MDELVFYLNQHIEIDEAVLVIDNFANSSIANNIVIQSSIKHLYVVCDCDEQPPKSNLPTFHKDVVMWYNSAQELPEKLNNCKTILFNLERHPEAILDYLQYRPERLLGVIQEGALSSFYIWEKFRQFCSYIQIRTNCNDKEPKVLTWTGSKTDIELSVILPMYNVAEYLECCIQSLVKWKANYVEFIFVNDGSPDNSRDIVLKWAEHDNRIKLIDKENGGCASARQAGMDQSRGKYIGFVDPDDFIDPNMFLELLRAALIGDYEIAYCGYNEYYNDTGTSVRAYDNLGFPYDKGCLDPRWTQKLIYACRVAIWREIFKRALIENNSIHFYTDLKRFDDLPFKVETFASARTVIAVNKYMYYYRLARPGQDVSADDERLFVHFDIFKHLNVSVASKKDQRLIDCLQLCKFATHVYALQKIKPNLAKSYITQAKEDLESTGSFFRTYRLIKQELGKAKARKYVALMLGNFVYIKRHV